MRPYADSRLHYLETSALQKGLILMFDDKELIEEGLGFGVLVVKYKDKTYFFQQKCQFKKALLLSE